jgi:hypothetical protein
LKKKENLKKGDPDFFNKSEEQRVRSLEGACKNNPLRLAKVKTKKKLKKRESRREKKFPDLCSPCYYEEEEEDGR